MNKALYKVGDCVEMEPMEDPQAYIEDPDIYQLIGTVMKVDTDTDQWGEEVYCYLIQHPNGLYDWCNEHHIKKSASEEIDEMVDV